ncbi:hypothetical protein, partial [Shigella boydii]
QGKISSDGCLKKEQMVVSAIASTPQCAYKRPRLAQKSPDCSGSNRLSMPYLFSKIKIDAVAPS